MKSPGTPRIWSTPKDAILLKRYCPIEMVGAIVEPIAAAVDEDAPNDRERVTMEMIRVLTWSKSQANSEEK